MTDAQTLTITLGGKWHGRYGVSACPVCQPERRHDQRGLSLANGEEGKLLVRCFKSGCGFRDIVSTVGLPSSTFARSPIVASKTDSKAETQKRSQQAARLWLEGKPIAGTPAEGYLRRRGITCPLPDTLRFHPGCWHGATGQRFPAMLALVEGGAAIALHRTYLRSDGSGKAPVTPEKSSLGTCAGGAVRLSDGAGPLVVAEGIETALSLVSGFLENPATVWSALSTSGIRGLRLPTQPGRLLLASDGDTPGRQATHALAIRADALGWDVSFLPAPEGCDWNDVLQSRAAA